MAYSLSIIWYLVLQVDSHLRIANEAIALVAISLILYFNDLGGTLYNICKATSSSSFRPLFKTLHEALKNLALVSLWVS